MQVSAGLGCFMLVSDGLELSKQIYSGLDLVQMLVSAGLVELIKMYLF